jgi:hypothetical protein
MRVQMPHLQTASIVHSVDTRPIGAVLILALSCSLTFLNGCASFVKKDIPKAIEAAVKHDPKAVKAAVEEDPKAVEAAVKDALEAGRVAGAQKAITSVNTSKILPEELGNSGSVVAKREVASQGQTLREIESSVSETKVASQMSETELRNSWNRDPNFRVEAIVQIAESDPSALGALAKESAQAPTFAKGAVASRSETISTLVADRENSLSLSSSTALAPAERKALNDRLVNIVGKVLDDLPKDIAEPTDAQLKSAIEKALKPDPKWSYSFDAETGKLTFKIKTSKGGDVATPPVKVYSLVRQLLYVSGIGTTITSKDDLVRLAKAYFAKPVEDKNKSQPRTD